MSVDEMEQYQKLEKAQTDGSQRIDELERLIAEKIRQEKISKTSINLYQLARSEKRDAPHQSSCYMECMGYTM